MRFRFLAFDDEFCFVVSGVLRVVTLYEPRIALQGRLSAVDD